MEIFTIHVLSDLVCDVLCVSMCGVDEAKLIVKASIRMQRTCISPFVLLIPRLAHKTSETCMRESASI